MKRRPTTQDISWFLDLNDNENIDLSPPYQRRSVWSRKDRVYFLDTIFKGYPCPAIFLHKTTDDKGKATYHVVDGKQRLETIFTFASNKFTMPKDFANADLAGKKFGTLDPELKQRFWDYVMAVDMLDIVEQAVVDEVFDRLNRNSIKLEKQELRHARYDGWFVRFAEDQSEKHEWRVLGISTTSRAKRMKDVQFISELLIYSITNEVQGFSQESIDEFYAKYNEPNEELPDFDVESFEQRFISTRDFIVEMERSNNCVSQFSKTYTHFYTLWNVIDSVRGEKKPEYIAGKYAEFMQAYTDISKDEVVEKAKSREHEDNLPLIYAINSIGANTEYPQRKARFEALKSALEK